jgi:hypothetical protein
MIKAAFEIQVDNRRTGKAPARSHMKMLQLGNYLKTDKPVPTKYDFWKGKVPFLPYDVGNNEYGDCTFASQALLAQRMERREQRKTVQIPKNSIVQAYFTLTERLYGSGDTGAYEMDALNNWRNPDYTFRDSKGRPHTIDAYVKINHSSIPEVQTALYLSQAKGIKVCFNLPFAWAYVDNNIWDIPEGQAPIGQYMPGSWGGHSMMADATYDEWGLVLPSTWNQPPGKISWRAFAIYADEAYLCIDSINAWKKQKVSKLINLDALKSDVNSVSGLKIK